MILTKGVKMKQQVEKKLQANLKAGVVYEKELIWARISSILGGNRYFLHYWCY